MEFINKIQNQFNEAGWNSFRNVSEKYKDVYTYDTFPDFLNQFLNKYGDLTVSDCKEYHSEVINQLMIKPEYSFFDYENVPDEDYNYYQSKIGKDVYPFAFFIQNVTK
jgi:hypothetical protein